MAILSPEEIKASAALAWSQEIIRVEVYSVKVYIEKLPEDSDKQPRMMAYLKAQCFPRKGKMRVHIFPLPVISVWRDPFDDNICKMHMLLKHDSKNLENLKMQEYLVRCIKEQGPLVYTRNTSNRMIISCDTTATVLRFGTALEAYANYNEANRWSRVPTFDTKAAALQALIDQAGKQVTLGGLDLINLNVIKDEFLEAIGFEKVPDLAGRGLPMWRGEVEKLALAGSGYSSGYSSWGSQRRSANTDSFVKILEQALEAA